jgi:sensor histidine kinase regulating citrate/malate metabolism
MDAAPDAHRLIFEGPASAASREPIEHSKRSGLGLKRIANSVRQIGGTLTTPSDENCYRTTIVIPQHQR